MVEVINSPTFELTVKRDAIWTLSNIVVVGNRDQVFVILFIILFIVVMVILLLRNFSEYFPHKFIFTINIYQITYVIGKDVCPILVKFLDCNDNPLKSECLKVSSYLNYYYLPQVALSPSINFFISFSS